MEKVVILSKAEFILMASLFEIKEVFGMSFLKERDDKWEADSENAWLVVHSLGEAGAIKNGGDGESKDLHVTEPYRSIFRQIKEARWVLQATGEEGESACFYIGEGCVLLEADDTLRQGVRLTLLGNDSIFDLLCDMDLLPNQAHDDGFDREKSLDDIKAHVVGHDESNIRLIVFDIKTDKKIIEDVRLIRVPIDFYIAHDGQMNYYTKDGCYDILAAGRWGK